MATQAHLGPKHRVSVAVIGLLALTLACAQGSVAVEAAVPDADDGTVPPPDPVAATAVPAASRIAPGSFFSEAMQMQRAFDIYLPPSYEQAPDRRYPVLYLLHGDGGRIDSWPSIGLRPKLDQAIANGMPETIVVMPDGAGHYGDLTDWANRWDGTDEVEDQVVELVAVIDAGYRTLPDRSTRFIGGFSSGGFGALNIALHHPDLFSMVMSLSGFIAADDPQADDGVFGTDRDYIEQNSPAVLVSSQPAAATLYYVLTGGVDDAYFQRRMAQLSDELDGLGIANEFHVVPGGHDATAWNGGLDFGLTRVSTQIWAAGAPDRYGPRE